MNPFSNKIYAGIGMRDKYPAHIREEVETVMYESAYALAFNGFTCRSGHAENTDIRFEQATLDAIRDGASGRLVSYLPRSYFNGQRADGKIYIDGSNMGSLIGNSQREYVNKFHPNPSALSTFGYSAMARNSNQILGDDLQTPSRFILSASLNPKFDKKGNIYDCKGGTGQAVRMAYHFKIPVFNLLHPPHLERMKAYIKNKHPKYQNLGINNSL